MSPAKLKSCLCCQQFSCSYVAAVCKFRQLFSVCVSLLLLHCSAGFLCLPPLTGAHAAPQPTYWWPWAKAQAFSGRRGSCLPSTSLVAAPGDVPLDLPSDPLSLPLPTPQAEQMGLWPQKRWDPRSQGRTSEESGERSLASRRVAG